MIAVCLLTCDRPELTVLSASSFQKYQTEDALLLHCDGGSLTDENVQIAKSYAYRTLVAPSRENRIGQMATLRFFVGAAWEAGCHWILWLENDWEAVAPLPTEEFLEWSGAETVRLFGAKKMRSGPRQWAGTRRMNTEERIEWVPVLPGWEGGRAHWGGGGTFVQTDILRRQLHLPRLKDVITAENNLVSLRPVDNLMWCNGLHTTEGVIG